MTNITALQTVPFHLGTGAFERLVEGLARLQSRYLLVNDALAIGNPMDIGFLRSIIEMGDRERFHPQHPIHLPEDRDPELPFPRVFAARGRR